MPFPKQNGIAFTRAGVESLLPGSTGCYGIFRDGLWIYVGRAQCIRARLLEHLNDTKALMHREGPTHFVTALSDNPEALEKSLIVELRPCCNQKVG